MPAAYHMVHYRRFEVDDGEVGGQSLEGLCRNALSTTSRDGVALWGRADARLLDLRDVAGGKILLNKVADLEDAVFGEMCFVESRGLQALLQLQASKMQLSNLTLAEVFGLAEREAPTGSQFVRGLAYWLAIGDHLFFVKTQAMSADRIQEYLHWLLKDATRAIAPTVNFRLQAAFDRGAHAGDVGEIRRLKISGKSAPRMVAAVGDDPGHDKVVGTRRKIADLSYISDKAQPLAEVIFGKSKTESLVEALGPDEYLSVDASVAVRGRRTERSKAMMKQLVNEVANESDAKVQIEGKDGAISEGDAVLRTRMPFVVPHDGSTLLEFDNVADQLQEVYSRFVQDGKIDA